MCGVAGIFAASPLEEAGELLGRMQAALAHRGPDGRGTWSSDNAALAHVRLAILDVEGGRQPMVSDDGRYVLSYNGEIYNFRELRSVLEGLGHVFRTSSDTEVLLKGWSQWGEGVLEKLNGMFAFALWDQRERRGILVRDPLGIKPFFYLHDGLRLYFASEAKAILEALSEPPSLDVAALHMLMNFRYLPGDMTLWQGIRQLRPGHILEWEGGGYRIRQWFLLPLQERSRNGARVVERAAIHIEKAVARQLVSDVPLGGYLSYGVDSGIIAAVSASILAEAGQEYPTFTIDTGDSPLEAAGAAETARLLGVANRQERLECDLGQLLPEIIYHLEVPKVNGLQSFLVARLASRHVKVALSGLGGDELFLGYNVHLLFRRFSRLGGYRPLTTFFRLLQPATTAALLRFSPYTDEYVRGCRILASGDPVFTYGILRNVWDGVVSREAIYGPRMLDCDRELPNAFDYLRREWINTVSDPLKAMQGYELKEKMVNDFLWNEDRLSMAHGLEVRVPLLDLELLDFAASLASDDLMAGGELKGLMRKAGARWLPREVLSRPKSGFQVPIHLFFDTHLRPLCRIYLERSRLTSYGLFNPEFIERVLRARPSWKLRWHYFMLYLMVGTIIWLERFNVR